MFWEAAFSTHIPGLTEGKRFLIFSSFIFLMFDDMYVFFLHAFSVMVNQLNFKYMSVVRGVSLLGWQNSVAIFFSPINLNNMRGNFSRRQRYVPALS